jgi:hypothetical protein
LLRDPQRRRELGCRGREVVHERFNDRVEAEKTLEVYATLLRGRTAHRVTA